MACVWQPRLQLMCAFVFAALLALNIDARRLGGGAAASYGSRVAGLATRASVPSRDSAAARAQRDMDLRAAINYIDSIAGRDYFHLANIKDILERFENIRERVLSFGAARDPRHRLQIRKVLRGVKEQGEALTVLAGKLQEDGEVDDGGDELPTKRNNICSRISEYHVESAILQLVQLFCESLDNVRKAVNAGEDEEPMAHRVSGMLSVLAMKLNYRQGHIGSEIEQVSGEERRWVAKHLAPPPAEEGNALSSPEGTGTRFRRWALRAWEIHFWADVEVDSAAAPFKALKQAHDILASAMVEDEDGVTLSSVCTRIQRIELCKVRLAQFISGNDAPFRERVREVFQDMKVRMDALHALSARKLAAGEVENGGDELPSQSDNICTKLDASGLQEDYREDVRKVCDAFDRLHLNAMMATGRRRSLMPGRHSARAHSSEWP